MKRELSKTKLSIYQFINNPALTLLSPVQSGDLKEWSPTASLSLGEQRGLTSGSRAVPVLPVLLHIQEKLEYHYNIVPNLLMLQLVFG